MHSAFTPTSCQPVDRDGKSLTHHDFFHHFGGAPGVGMWLSRLHASGRFGDRRVGEGAPPWHPCRDGAVYPHGAAPPRTDPMKFSSSDDALAVLQARA